MKVSPGVTCRLHDIDVRGVRRDSFLDSSPESKDQTTGFQYILPKLKDRTME